MGRRRGSLGPWNYWRSGCQKEGDVFGCDSRASGQPGVKNRT